MTDLIIAGKKKYFEQIKSGEKKEEYRLFNEYWIQRLEGKNFDRLIITLGYPKKDDKEKRLIFKYKGYQIKPIQHELFGKDPLMCFAIDLSERIIE